MEDLLLLNRSQIKAAAQTMSQAFHKYPVSVYAFPDEGTRQQKMPHFFRFILHYCQSYGEVYATSPNMEGVAAWLSSDNVQLPVGKVLRSVPLSVMFRVTTGGWKKMRDCGEHFDAVHQRLIPYRHHFLQMIGVRPEYQGKGYGSKLIRPVLDRIDKEGLACYLETQDDIDVPLYEHYGFKIIDESIIPGTDLVSRAMLREARLK